MRLALSHRIISRQRSPLLFSRTDLLPCDEIPRDLRSGNSFCSSLIENSQVLGANPKERQNGSLCRFPAGVGHTCMHA